MSWLVKIQERAVYTWWQGFPHDTWGCCGVSAALHRGGCWWTWHPCISVLSLDYILMARVHFITTIGLNREQKYPNSSIGPYQMLGFLTPTIHCFGDRWPFWGCSPMRGSGSYWCHTTTEEESLLLPHLIIFVLPLLSPGCKLLLLTTCGLMEPYFRWFNSKFDRGLMQQKWFRETSDEDGAAPKEAEIQGDSLKGWKSMKRGKDKGGLAFSRRINCETAPKGIFLSSVRVPGNRQAFWTLGDELLSRSFYKDTLKNECGLQNKHL